MALITLNSFSHVSLEKHILMDIKFSYVWKDKILALVAVKDGVKNQVTHCDGQWH